MAEDVRERVMLTLHAKFPILKRLFFVKSIGIFGNLARGYEAPGEALDLAVEFEPEGDTYRNFINLAYYLDELLDRQVNVITRRTAADFISADIGTENTERKRDRDCILGIHQEVMFLIKQVRGHDQREFLQDELLKKATLRSLEVIGECAFLVSPELKSRHPEIPWTEFAGLRFRLIHPFFGPDWVLVWDVLASEIPRIEGPVTRLSGPW